MNYTTKTAFLLGIALSFTGHAWAEIVLVQDGASDYEIVQGPNPGPVVRLAASELQEFIRKATEVTLPIVNTASPEKGHVFLGANPASNAAGIALDDLQPEGFHLKTVGRDVHIVGADTHGNAQIISSNYPVQCGTMNGVYELLERHVGVLFAWHGELGTVVPHSDEIVLPKLDITDAPDWHYRTLAYGPEGQEYKLFGRRLRLGSTLATGYGHAWFSILPVEEYGAEHPEYFALVDGKRQTSHYLGHNGGQVCTSNEKVIEIFAKKAIDYFSKDPTKAMFSISPNDGGGFCECDACRALDGGEMLADDPGKPVLTDRLLAFFNAIAQRVVKVHPDKLLSTHVYSYYQNPPRREKVHPNLWLSHATNSAEDQGHGWEQEHGHEKQWLALTRKFVKYDIPYNAASSMNLMAPVTTHIGEKLKAEHAIGLFGAYEYMGQSYEQLGAGHYVMAKLMWDKDADVPALERTYYNGLYGPAGPDIAQYYHLLERRLRKVILEGMDVDEPVVTQQAPRGHRVLAAYWPILDQASVLIDQAAERELTDLQRRRLERLVAQHDLLVGTVRGFISAGRMSVQGQFNPADVQMLKQAVELREAAKTRIAEYAPTLAGSIEAGDKDQTAIVTPGGAFFQLTQAQKPLRLSSIRAKKTPKVDGAGDDAVWQQAPLHYLLMTENAVSTDLGARARIAFDDTHLFVFVDGREEEDGKLLANTTERDSGDLFDDDAVEVFLQPPGGKTYYQIALGAGGGVLDAKYPQGNSDEVDLPWDSQVKARVDITSNAWSAEFAIPFATLGARPQDGTWRMNICRTRRGNVQPDQYTAVSPTFGGYHVPSRFAPLDFGEASGAPAFAHGTIDDVRTEKLQQALRSSGNVELVTDRVYAGSQAAHITVPEDSLGSITLEAAVKAETGYRALVAHYNHVTGHGPGATEKTPRTRVIFADDSGKAVTPTSGYSWDGTTRRYRTRTPRARDASRVHDAARDHPRPPDHILRASGRVLGGRSASGGAVAAGSTKLTSIYSTTLANDSAPYPRWRWRHRHLHKTVGR